MIYFDNASTSIIEDSVLKSFNEIIKSYPANPNSNHRIGFLANRKLQQARDDILKTLKLDKEKYDVIFNSGATEGINHVIKGYALKNQNRGLEIISFNNEHIAVLKSLDYLRNKGFKITYVNCDKNGEIDYNDLQKKINNQTIMVIVMSVNNEVGAINDIVRISDIVSKYKKCVFFSDITQSVGKIQENYNGIDMMAFSPHKFGGLTGSGVLIKKKKILLEKLIDGGSQENNYRSGTASLALHASSSYALQLANSNLKKNLEKVNNLKKILINELSSIDEIEINSHNKFPYIINFSLKNKKASVVIEALSQKEIYVSSLSACSSKLNKKSYVLTNMNKNFQISTNSIRVSFSHNNTEKEVLIFVKEIKEILNQIK
ncbi:MAG: aminotransferase class V-fold PLP-dependent enzyme [Bacilli bacterium]|nr:aminotransferase class V-fold PLP-dependent enzyme [Bacilli bacterium]